MAVLNDLRNGLVIRLGDVIYTIVDCQHVKPGKGGAFARTKLKRLTDGAVIDRTFRSSESIETVRVEGRDMQFMYSDGNLLHFMDNETFETAYAVDGSNRRWNEVPQRGRDHHCQGGWRYSPYC